MHSVAIEVGSLPVWHTIPDLSLVLSTICVNQLSLSIWHAVIEFTNVSGAIGKSQNSFTRRTKCFGRAFHQPALPDRNSRAAEEPYNPATQDKPIPKPMEWEPTRKHAMPPHLLFDMQEEPKLAFPSKPANLESKVNSEARTQFSDPPKP